MAVLHLLKGWAAPHDRAKGCGNAYRGWLLCCRVAVAAVTNKPLVLLPKSGFMWLFSRTAIAFTNYHVIYLPDRPRIQIAMAEYDALSQITGSLDFVRGQNGLCSTLIRI
jgi:hypothetical protein